MDSHQGGDFTFDMNMDFSNVFGTKPNEGETSTDFFFGDEGIDTTASLMGSGLFPQQTAFHLQQDYTLDNTSGSASVWNSTLTPQIQNTINMFPPTPSHSFDSTYQTFGSTLGKRGLQLDADLPAAKRHETADYTTGFSPLLPSASASTWALDAQNTPASSVEMGISDEAADMCATWFKKYAILPSDRHIESLSQLTGEPADAIRHWFGRLMKQGMGTSQGDSAYKSQTALQQPENFWNSFEIPQLIQEESTQDSFTTPAPAAHETVTVSPSASSNALRGGKKSRCTPTEDESLLSRDPNKIYQCTRKCGKRYGRKCDWKRNEEEGYPCKSWVCSLCISEGVDKVKPCFRKYHFAQHFRNIHPGVNCDDYEETSVVCSETEFPRKCGFCKHRFSSRQERIDHIADHFKQGKCMLDWNESEDGPDSDNTDGDDDKPSDDGSDDSGPSYQPPDRHPRGGSDPKYFGGGSGFNNGGSGGPSQGGFFQFQLSQLNSQYRSSSSDDKQNVLRHTRCASEPIYERSVDQPSSAGPWYTRSSLDTAKRDNTDALARDDVSRLVAHGHLDSEAEPQDQQQVLAETEQPTEDDTVNLQSDWLDVLLSTRKRRKPSQPMSTPLAGPSSGQVMPAHSPLAVAGDETESTPFDNGALSAAMGRERKAHPTSLSPQDPKATSTIAPTSPSFLSVRFLGSGGFSTVDEVVHRGTKLRLGRKTLNNRTPDAIKELWKEVNVLQKLRHPHVIRFLGAYSKGDKMSILLSPIADTTLALWLDRYKQSQPANFSHVITKMFGCLASSVRYLHEQRPVIKHMDIKPQNILIVEGGGESPHVVLCDFGISSSDDITEGRMQPLTRQYVAPEAFEGFTRKQAADIWSLGCVFAEMASVTFRQDNASWDELRKEFSGRSSKYYWQDVPALQDRLATLLEVAATATESTVVRTLQSMLEAQPEERPDAAALTMIFTPASCCLSWPNDKVAYPSPQEELSLVESLALEDGMEHCTQLQQHGHANPGYEEGLPSAKSWIEQCSHSHSACGHATSSNAKALPTRLVDISPEGQAGSYIRIVNATTIAPTATPVRYIALSHVWSSSDTTLSTERLQLSDSHADMPLSTLSQAMNAAITTAQRLDYRYIWVDSLCILQDSPADKRHECANMASTFRNAALTLVLDNVDNGMNSYLESMAKSSSASIDQASSGFAWDTRAWALQERLLSHRFLHLGQEQMYWECNSLKASETFPQGLPSLVWEKAHTKPEAARPHGGIKRQSVRLVQDSLRVRNQGGKMDAPHDNEEPLVSEPEPANECEVPDMPKDSIFATAQGNVKCKVQGHIKEVEPALSVGGARGEVCVSGQADQNGSMKRVNGNGNGNGGIEGMSRRNGNGSGGWNQKDGEGSGIDEHPDGKARRRD